MAKEETHTSYLMCVINMHPGGPAPGENANSGKKMPEDDQATVHLQPYIGRCIDCGREFVLYYETTLPERHVLDIVPVLCPTCEEKFFWQEVRR